MRILHIINSLRTGGAERLMVDLLPRLASRGHIVELLLFDGVRTPFLSEIERRGITVRSLRSGTGNAYSPLLCRRLCRFVRAGSYDIVHTHNTAPQLFGAVASLRCRPRFFTTEHNTNNRRRGKEWLRRVDRWLYSRYEKVICVSTAVREALVEWVPEAEPRCRVVTNGVDLSRFASAKPSAEVAARWSGLHVVSMVARFDPQKDQPTLIRALALLPTDFRLCLAGEGATMDDCRELARRLGVEDRVWFMGVRGDVAEIYRASETVVFSSNYEGLPLSAIEGMASGRPLVASDAPGINDVARGAGILFPTGDHKALAQIIEKLAADPALRAETSKRCMERADLYGIEQMVDGYEALYLNLD